MELGLHLSSPLQRIEVFWGVAEVSVAAAVAKSLQSCPTLCDPIDGSPPGSPGPGILQARTLEWVAISFSSAWTWKLKVKSLSRVRLLATPWTAAYQAPLCMGFSRQEYWSVPLPSPEVSVRRVQIRWMTVYAFRVLSEKMKAPQQATQGMLYIQEKEKFASLVEDTVEGYFNNCIRLLEK